ncbi:zinc-binding protein A33-like, partial [Anguilla rostrata]|uniref:zinc-binding protein A33-like n=1 Tax=Anguilla rostrata TaxID=7938 RepID=UPI0030CF668E
KAFSDIGLLVPLTLDPNTVHPCLSLSDDLTRVRNTGDKHPLPDNPERFDFGVAVLGSEGYTSGKHSWEVEVGNKPSWSLGVARKSVDRKGQIRAIPEKGFWVLSQRNWDLYGACSSEKKCIKLRRKPQRIRVQLDYDRGVVSFFDPSDMTQIYTCKGTFRERMFPFLSPYLSEDGSNPGALTICPGSVSIIAMSFQ